MLSAGNNSQLLDASELTFQTCFLPLNFIVFLEVTLEFPWGIIWPILCAWTLIQSSQISLPKQVAPPYFPTRLFQKNNPAKCLDAHQPLEIVSKKPLQPKMAPEAQSRVCSRFDLNVKIKYVKKSKRLHVVDKGADKPVDNLCPDCKQPVHNISDSRYSG